MSRFIDVFNGLRFMVARQYKRVSKRRSSAVLSSLHQQLVISILITGVEEALNVVNMMRLAIIISLVAGTVYHSHSDQSIMMLVFFAVIANKLTYRPTEEILGILILPFSPCDMHSNKLKLNRPRMPAIC